MNEPNDPIPPPDIPKPDMPAPADAPPVPAVAVRLREPGAAPPPVEGAAAPLGARVVAGVLDCLFATGLMLLVTFLLPGFSRIDERIGNVAAIAYILGRDCLPFLKGRSIGKMAMKLRVVTDTGAPLTNNWQPGILRNVALIIPFFGFVELIVLLTREGKPGSGRRLGDDWAKTKVIMEPGPAAM